MGRDYPAGVPCWTDVTSTDPHRLGEFYAGLFDWEMHDRTPPGAATPYLVATLGGSDVAGIGALLPAEAAPAWQMYVRVEDVVAAAARVAAAGGQVRHEPYEVPHLARVAECADPAGAVFRLWQGRHGAERVNAPGTWNFNELNTTDLAGAGRFYPAALGWQLREVDFGYETATMWCVPGYGKVQDSWDPGFVSRHEQGGSPDGFVDAVGWAHPLGPDTATGATPHWSVTFAVADAAGVAQRAVRAGGEVLVAPYSPGDGSVVATLRDPAGAVFVINEWHG